MRGNNVPGCCISLKRYFRDTAMGLKGPIDIYRMEPAEYISLIQTREVLQREKAVPSSVTGWDVRMAEFQTTPYDDGKYKKGLTTSICFTRKMPVTKGNIDCDILFSELPPKNKKKRYGVMFKTSCNGCERTRYLALRENMESNVVWKMMVIGTGKLAKCWNPESGRFEETDN